MSDRRDKDLGQGCLFHGSFALRVSSRPDCAVVHAGGLDDGPQVLPAAQLLEAVGGECVALGGNTDFLQSGPRFRCARHVCFVRDQGDQDQECDRVVRHGQLRDQSYVWAGRFFGPGLYGKAAECGH